MKISPIVGTLLAFIFGAICMKAVGAYFSLKIPQTENITFFRKDDGKQIPIFQLDPQGVLLIDIPAMMKQYQDQRKTDKK